MPLRTINKGRKWALQHKTNVLWGRRAAYVWAIFLVVSFFVLDAFLPLGVAAGVLYSVAVMVSMHTSKTRFIVTVTVVSVLLTILGLLMSPDGGETWKVVANRVLAIFVILGAGVFAIYAIAVRRRSTRQAIMFEQVRRRRTQDVNVQLMRSAEARNEFLGQISHELRTPLTSLTTFAHILDEKSETLSRERVRAHAEVISRNARRLEVLVNDIFDASGTVTDSFKLNLATIDLPQIVQNTTNDYVNHIRTRDQELTTEIDIPEGSNFHAIADLSRIAQVVANLLSNASKYSLPGSTINIFCGLESGKYIVKVTDHGNGISTGDISKVFTPFFRVDSSDVRSVPGAGLGLTIAKSIIELHDGQIYIESELEIGTTVSFAIPAIADIPVLAAS
ncbi:MAG: HAMP domain-containing histidine kinase [Chloroflexi bacterium]|nr:HAMP domain-containing histidine kinase [Chloroflexota bacterium]